MSTVSDWEHREGVSQHLLTIDLKLQPRTPSLRSHVNRAVSIVNNL